MNGPHDMGGMQCFGRLEVETDEPFFHSEWEKKAMSLTVAMGFTGAWNIDMSRQAREKLPPSFYLSKSYYQIWLAGLESLMLERGLVTRSELESGRKEIDPVDLKRIVSAEEVPAVLARGGPVDRKPENKSKFAVGDAVRTLNINPKGHTRLPRYARGKSGVIAGVHGCHVYPDSNAVGGGENPQWLYSVAFKARELFGPEAESGNEVMADCWEPWPQEEKTT